MANEIRGEAEVTVGGSAGLTLVLAASMEGLARLSAATACHTMHELHERMVGTEPTMIIAVVRNLTQRGTLKSGEELDAKAAIRNALSAMDLSDFARFQNPLRKILNDLIREPEPGEEPPDQGEAERT